MPDIQHCIYDLLSNLRSDRQLKDLFLDLDYLKYTYINQPLSSRQLGDKSPSFLANDPLLLGGHDQFHIICCTLRDQRLPRGQQRLIVEQLLKHHPWCLVVFTNPQRSQWQFVNLAQKTLEQIRSPLDNIFKR